MGLKERRIKKGLKQEDISRKTGINLRTYQNIEKRNDTTVSNAKKISDVMEETIEEIFFE